MNLYELIPSQEYIVGVYLERKTNELGRGKTNCFTYDRIGSLIITEIGN